MTNTRAKGFRYKTLTKRNQMLRARQFSKKCRRNIRWMHVIQLHTIYFMKNEENQAERRHSKNFGIVFEAVYCHSSLLLHLNEVISYKWFLELLEMKFWIKKPVGFLCVIHSFWFNIVAVFMEYVHESIFNWHASFNM